MSLLISNNFVDLCDMQKKKDTDNDIVKLKFFPFVFSARFLFACMLDCLLVTMAQDNIKLCDFSNTNNNDFLSTPIAPLNDAESCEINAALLNLVMNDHFSGLPSEDACRCQNRRILGRGSRTVRLGGW